MSIETAPPRRTRRHIHKAQDPLDLYSIQELTKSKTSLDEDTFLSAYIDKIKNDFRDPEQFRKGAELAHATIQSIDTDLFPDMVSEDVVSEFDQYVEVDHERSIARGHYSDFYAKKKPNGKRGFDTFADPKSTGERKLFNNLYFASTIDPELSEMFRGFQEPETRYGMFTVLTLKERQLKQLQEPEAVSHDSNLIQIYPEEIAYLSNVS